MIFTNKSTIKQTLDQAKVGDTISVSGWIRAIKAQKNLAFIDLVDGSNVNKLQVIALKDLDNYAQISKLTKDCSLTITGQLNPSPGSGQDFELLAQQITVISQVQNPDSYPVSAKAHTQEHLREVAHLRIRTSLISSIMRIRNSVSFAIHQYLQQHDFNWVHTPIITSSDAEGAGELFRVTTLNTNELNQAIAKNNYSQDFFQKEAFLTVSGQLNLEAYCMGLSRVYTFGPTFRAEMSRTTRHLAEFWMVEPEIAFANLQDDAKLAEGLIQYVFNHVLKHNTTDIEVCAKKAGGIDLIARLETMTRQNFEMMSYTKAIEHLEKSTKTFETPISWGMDLASEHERWLCEELVANPLIITDYPKDIKAFYMRQNDDGKTVSAMDILAPGIGEIAGGSAREERYDPLVNRMQELGLNQEHMSWYLDLRRFGSVPHAGFGLGLERLIMYITGTENIRDVIPFPRFPDSIKF